MAAAGLILTDVRGQLDAASVAARKPRFAVESARVRITEEGLRRLPPPGAPVTPAGIGAGSISFRGSARGVGFSGEGRATAAPSGRLRIEITSVRAAGFIPIPLFVIAALLRDLLPAQAGLSAGEGSTIEIDFAEIARPLGIELPPLRSVHAEAGILELCF